MNLQPISAQRPGRFVKILLITSVVLLVFYSTISLNFVGDDWIFLDIVGRLNVHDYLVKYFDPFAQTAWYRPVQGIQYLINFQLFGSDPLGYHLENVLLHLVNCWLLFGLVTHVTKRSRTGLIAALLYATWPIAVEGIFKAGVIDPLLATFSLLSIWFWLCFLERGGSRNYWLAFVNFILALYCKEISVMLPAILFLIDRLYVRQPMSLSDLVRRYYWFGLAFAPYLPIEYIVTRRSVFVQNEGYSAGAPVLANLIDYAGGLAFPWSVASPVNYLFLVGALAALFYRVVRRKRFALVSVGALAILPVLPIALFPQVSPRFLYFPLTASAFLWALGFDWVLERALGNRILRAFALGGIAIACAIGGQGIDNNAIGFAEFSRISRLTFRNIRLAHPIFPNDTLLYFIDPPVPGPGLSGMFFSRFGSSVVVQATDSDQPARLRDHAVAYVFHFDAQGDPVERLVEKNLKVNATPILPLDFGTLIRLENFELVDSQVKPGQPILLLIYWRALKPIAKDYVVIVNLVDQKGSVTARYEKEPRSGKSHTSAWALEQHIVDAIQLPVPEKIPAGTYRLEVGLFDPSTGQMLGERAVIEPLQSAP